MSRTRMPHNNRVSGSTALKTNDMWSKTIGYDPYAAAPSGTSSSTAENEAFLSQTAGLMLLAKMSNLSGVESRGGCKKCGMLGHLTYQCRNVTAVPQSNKDDNADSSDSNSDDSKKEYDDAKQNPIERSSQDLGKRLRPNEIQSEITENEKLEESNTSKRHKDGKSRHKLKRKDHKSKSRKHSKKEKKSKKSSNEK